MEKASWIELSCGRKEEREKMSMKKTMEFFAGEMELLRKKNSAHRMLLSPMKGRAVCFWCAPHKNGGSI